MCTLSDTSIPNLFPREWKYRKTDIDGDTLICTFFFLLLVYAFYSTILLLQNKCIDFVSILNTLFQVPVVKYSWLIQFMYFNVPIVGVLVPVLCALFSVTKGIDPITVYIMQLPSYRHFIVLCILRVCLTIFEIWNAMILSNFTVLLCYQGMFCSYIALYEISKELQFTAIQLQLQLQGSTSMMALFVSTK